jgi:hypothetical protein
MAQLSASFLIVLLFVPLALCCDGGVPRTGYTNSVILQAQFEFLMDKKLEDREKE